MTLDQARESYRNDPHFHAVVDAMTKWILDMHVTPAEVRAAAMFAAIRAENLRPSPYTVPLTGGDTAK